MFGFFLKWRYQLKWKRDMFLWKLENFNERYNPYAQIATLTRSIQRLNDLLDHASCVCGKRLDLENVYGCIECEHCQGLAIVDHPHSCEVYLGDGHFWCKPCVVAVACQYQLASPEDLEDFKADPDIAGEWASAFPEGQFLQLVQEAEAKGSQAIFV